MSKQDLGTTIDTSRLHPFHGYQTSIIPLASNYYFYLASWDENPTPFPHFSNVWLITPDDRRILFSDPPASSEVVCIYHVFHEIYAASIAVDWITETQIQVQCKSADGAFDLDAKFDVRESLLSRLLVAMGSGPPTPFRTSRPIIALSNFLLDALVTKSGSMLLGRTETGQPYYHGETDNLFRIAGGSMVLNGEDIGPLTSPTWSLEFGDSVPFFKPVIKLGTLYLPFEQEVIDASA
jgi:hypothetical protein